jgi:two-component system, sensor histidine kinase and response regulator
MNLLTADPRQTQTLYSGNGGIRHLLGTLVPGHHGEVAPSSGLLDSITVGVYLVNRAGTCTFANAAGAGLLGYDRADRLVGKNIQLLAHRFRPAVDVPTIDEFRIERACREGKTIEAAEELFWRPDGTRVPVECSVHPMVWPGEAAGAVVTVVDRRVCKGLQQELWKLASLVDSSEDLIGMASEDLKVTFVNKGGARLTGLANPDQALGRDVREFLTPSSCQLLEKETLPAVASTGSWQGEMQLLSAAGNIVDVLTNSFLVRHSDTGQVLGQATIMRDITARKCLERERRMLALLVESSSDFIGIASPDGHITYLNDGASNLVGLEDPASGLGLHVSAFHTAEAWEHLQSEVIPAATREGHWRGETQVRNFKTGEIIDVLLNAFMLETPDEERTLSLCAVMHDISEHKKMEESLRRAKDAAELANRLKSEFLANMSHEIRTPMNGILGMTGVLLDTELTAEQREYLCTVKESADSLLRIINDILDFSKIEAGKLDLCASEFDLREMLDEITKLMLPEAGQKGLHLRCGVSSELPRALWGDSVRLRQIIVNLIGNAVKFTRHGGIDVSASVELEGGADLLLRVDVKDTGIGIPPEKQLLIFNPFTQADGSMTRKFGGTGLGLTISTRLVEMMGGKIWVDSVPGEGSTFHFTARIRAAGAANAPAA